MKRPKGPTPKPQLREPWQYPIVIFLNEMERGQYWTAFDTPPSSEQIQFDLQDYLSRFLEDFKPHRP